jgi:hypothetical protein
MNRIRHVDKRTGPFGRGRVGLEKVGYSASDTTDEHGYYVCHVETDLVMNIVVVVVFVELSVAAALDPAPLLLIKAYMACVEAFHFFVIPQVRARMYWHAGCCTRL